MWNCSTVAGMIRPCDYDVFVGMDTDKRSIAITHVDHEGLERSLKIPNDCESLLGWVRNHLAGRRACFVYEAGPTGFGLYDILTGNGHKCLVVSPSAVPRARGKRVRTNRLDSRKLAYALRGGNLEGIRVPTGRYRELRELVQLRGTQVAQLAGAKQRIKALFLRNGLCFPDERAHWTDGLINHLREFVCQGAVRVKLDFLLNALQFHQSQANCCMMAIHNLVRSDAELSESVDYAMSIPGIGWVVATYAIARIGDWRLLCDSDETASFFGLVPAEDSTGEKSDRGPITKAGDPIARSLLVEAAWVACAKDPEMAAFYRRVYASHPRDKAARIAIVAVARKLATRLHCVLKEQRYYELRVAA